MRPYVRDVLTEIKSRGLKARAILEVNNQNLSAARLLATAFEVRHYEPLHVHLYVVDNHSVGIGLTPTTETDPEKLAQIVSTYPSYVKAIREFFEGVWRQAIPLDNRVAMLQDQEEGIPQTRVIWGREALYETRKDWIRTARRRIGVITTSLGPFRILGRYKQDSQEFSKAFERGIKIQLLCHVTPENLTAVRKLADFAEIHDRDAPFSFSIWVRDKSEAIIQYVNPDAPTIASNARDFAIHTTEKHFVRDLLTIFDSLWRKSKPFNNRKRLKKQ